MNIVQLVPGVGGSFYCENCLRDHALARALLQAGEQVSLVPLYLPVVADEPGAVRNRPIFFGGINVYLSERFGFLRHLPRVVRDFLDSPALLKRVSALAGMTSANDLAKATISMLMGEHGRQRRELERLIEYLTAHDRPDVVILSNALLVGMTRRIKKALGVPVLCLLQDEDIFLDSLPEAKRELANQILSERAQEVDAFLAVSEYCRSYSIDRFGLDGEKVHVVPIGLRLEEYQLSFPVETPVIGYMERLCPDKGLDVLIEAFILLTQRPMCQNAQLWITGGQTTGDEAFIAHQHARLDDWHLAGQVRWLENLMREDRLEFLRSLSVLSVPARHAEAFGLYAVEAMASGVPVVEPAQGAFPEMIQATGGGLLFAPNDPKDLADKLEKLVIDTPAALQMGRQGRLAVFQHFGLEGMAQRVLSICRELGK